MPKDHRSFFERLTGSVNASEGENEDFEEEEETEPRHLKPKHEKETVFKRKEEKGEPTKAWDENEEEGQLAVDMSQTPNEIIIQAVVAGTRPDEMDVSITQDMVTIRGKRQKQRETSGDDYYYQELYWGGFSRSILLPQEVDSEAGEATMKHGILTIKLPKLDKNRVQKLKVKNE